MLLGKPVLHGRLQYFPSVGLFCSEATFAHVIHVQVCWLCAESKTTFLLHTEQNG